MNRRTRGGIFGAVRSRRLSRFGRGSNSLSAPKPEMEPEKKPAADANGRVQRHFRKVRSGKYTGHPGYVVDDVGGDFSFIGVTKSPETHGKQNVPLDRNPEPGNKAPAFLRPQVDREKKGAFSQRLKDWKLADSDKPKVENIIQSNKKPRKPRK